MLTLFFFFLVFSRGKCCYASCSPRCFLNSPYFFRFFFLFAALPDCFFFPTFSSKTLIQSSASSNLWFFASSVLFISNITFFISDWFFLWFLCLFSCWWVGPYVITLNSISDKLLSFISSTSSGKFSCSFILVYFFVFLFLAAFYFPV